MARGCSFELCERPHSALGLCRAHYTQQKRGTPLHPLRGVAPPRGCDYPGCDRPHDSHDYCNGHANQVQRGEPLGPLKRPRLSRRACAGCGHEFTPRTGDHDKCCKCRKVKSPDRVRSRQAPAGRRWCKGCEQYRAKRFFSGTSGRCRPCFRVYNTDRRAQQTYGLPAGMYARLLEGQGGVCFICRVATGKKKALSVDHDHACCSGRTSCGKCVRGLLCGGCNYKILGHLRDSTEALQRAIDYLDHPPAREIIRA